MLCSVMNYKYFIFQFIIDHLRSEMIRVIYEICLNTKIAPLSCIVVLCHYYEQAGILANKGGWLRFSLCDSPSPFMLSSSSSSLEVISMYG